MTEVQWTAGSGLGSTGRPKVIAATCAVHQPGLDRSAHADRAQDDLRKDLGRYVVAHVGEEAGDLAQSALTLGVPLVVGGFAEGHGQAIPPALRSGPKREGSLV